MEPPKEFISIQSDAAITDFAREMSRIGRLIGDVDTQGLHDYAALLRDHMTRIDEIMIAHQIELRDHTGEPWVDGLPLVVVYVQEDVSDPVIVETIRPSIVLDGRIIAHGYVVIGNRSELEQTT